ncbi:MAG: hypothetical protein ABIP07_04760 [Sphingomicrobium sp.]
MWKREQWRSFIDHPVVEWSIFVVGAILMILSPVAGIIPGPGGIFVFAIGLAMVLKTSMWAKRHYVRFKYWQPKVGRWADWGLRRKSAKRRESIRKERATIGCPPPADELDEGPIASVIPGPPAHRPELPGDSERPEDRTD